MVAIPLSAQVTLINFEIMRYFVRSLARRANITTGATRIGVFAYNTEVIPESVFPINNYSSVEDLHAALEEMPYVPSQEPVSLEKALEKLEIIFASQETERLSVPDLAFLFITDGVQINSTLEQASRLRNASVRVFVLAIGSGETLGELRPLLQQITYREVGYIIPVQDYFTLLFLGTFWFMGKECGE